MMKDGISAKSFPSLGGVHVWPQDPFIVGLVLIEGTQFELIELHLKARTNFLKVELLLLVSFPGVRMVPERDLVLKVSKSHNALGIRFGDGKEILKNVGNASAESSIKSVKDKVWDSLRHSAQFLGVEVMSHDDVSEVEIGGGSERKVGDDEAIWLSPVLVQNNDICHGVSASGSYEL